MGEEGGSPRAGITVQQSRMSDEAIMRHWVFMNTPLIEEIVSFITSGGSVRHVTEVCNLGEKTQNGTQLQGRRMLSHNVSKKLRVLVEEAKKFDDGGQGSDLAAFVAGEGVVTTARQARSSDLG